MVRGLQHGVVGHSAPGSSSSPSTPRNPSRTYSAYLFTKADPVVHARMEQNLPRHFNKNRTLRAEIISMHGRACIGLCCSHGIQCEELNMGGVSCMMGIHMELVFAHRELGAVLVV